MAPIFFAGASIKDVCVCQGCCCGYFLLLECLGVTLFFFHDSQLRTNMTLRTNWVCWSDLVGFLERHLSLFLLHVCRFALPGTWRAHNVPCMLWAQCIWPKGNAMWMEKKSDPLINFMFLFFWCMSNYNYTAMFVHHIYGTVALYSFGLWLTMIYLHIVEEVWFNYKTRNTGMKTLRNYHGGKVKTDAYISYNLCLCRMHVNILQLDVAQGPDLERVQPTMMLGLGSLIPLKRF